MTRIKSKKTPAAAKNHNSLRIRFFTYFWLRHPGSVTTSGVNPNPNNQFLLLSVFDISVNSQRLRNAWPGISLYPWADGVKPAISQATNLACHQCHSRLWRHYRIALKINAILAYFPGKHAQSLYRKYWV